MGRLDAVSICFLQQVIKKAVVKAITAVAEDGAPRKRIRAHLRESELRKLIEASPRKLDQLVAIAAYKAEEVRAEAEERPAAEREALAGFERNPLRWEAAGWKSQVDVCFLRPSYPQYGKHGFQLLRTLRRL